MKSISLIWVHRLTKTMKSNLSPRLPALYVCTPPRGEETLSGVAFFLDGLKDIMYRMIDRQRSAMPSDDPGGTSSPLNRGKPLFP
jgi:hypothetical protein